MQLNFFFFNELRTFIEQTQHYKKKKKVSPIETGTTFPKPGNTQYKLQLVADQTKESSKKC